MPTRSRASTSFAPAHVPDRVAEHAAQQVDGGFAVFFVEVHERLGIARGPQLVALLLQLRAQVAVVVDLAVEDGDDRAVLVEDRLVAAGEIDDAQTARAERDAVVREVALAVGPAMDDPIRHPADESLVALRANVSDDATHELFTRSRQGRPSR